MKVSDIIANNDTLFLYQTHTFWQTLYTNETNWHLIFSFHFFEHAELFIENNFFSNINNKHFSNTLLNFSEILYMVKITQKNINNITKIANHGSIHSKAGSSLILYSLQGMSWLLFHPVCGLPCIIIMLFYVQCLNA